MSQQQEEESAQCHEASGEEKPRTEGKEKCSSGTPVDEDRDVDESLVSILKPQNPTAGGKVSKSGSSPKKVKYAEQVATVVDDLPYEDKNDVSYVATPENSKHNNEEDGNEVNKTVEMPPGDTGLAKAVEMTHEDIAFAKAVEIPPEDTGFAKTVEMPPEDTGFLLLSQGASADDSKGSMVREKCISCKEFLRGYCVLCHSKEPPSIGPYNSPRRAIPRSPSQTSETCNEHKTKSADFFCREHSVLICALCLGDVHENCVTARLSEIEDEAYNNKDFRTIETHLSALTLEVEERKKLAAKKVESLKRYRDKTLASIHEIRNKLEAHLDRLKEEIVHETNEYMNEDLHNIETMQASYGSMLYDLKVAHSELANTRKNEQGVNLFIALKHARCMHKQYQEMLNGEKFDGRLRFHDFEPDVDLTKLILTKQSLGELIVQHTDIAEGEHGATINRVEAAVEEKMFTEIDIRTKDNDMKCCISEMLPSHNGNLIMVDTENTSIKFLDVQSESVPKELVLTNIPSGVCMWGLTELIVTLPASGEIISLKTDPEGTPINCGKRYRIGKGCHGISSLVGVGLVVAFQNPDCEPQGCVKVISHRGDTLYHLPDPPVKYSFALPQKVAVDDKRDNIFITDLHNNKVICMLNDVDECIEYTHPDMVQPSGVTVGPAGNILVCGFLSNNVQRVTPDGKLIDTPLTEADGICGPYSIAYSLADDKLYIGSYNDNIQVFQLNLLTKGEEEQ